MTFEKGADEPVLMGCYRQLFATEPSPYPNPRPQLHRLQHQNARLLPALHDGRLQALEPEPKEADGLHAEVLQLLLLLACRFHPRVKSIN